jgi:ABC-type polar amino acid transport system ATPase subunit
MIELRNLRKEYDDVTPLKDINLSINSGDVIAVIGLSGTGKSTLLRCINMLETPTSGEIIVDGQIINDGKCDLNEVRKNMGMVFQSFNLFGHLTALENIMNPQITLLGRNRQEAYEKAMDLLNKVGLWAKALSYPDELSGGQQQRVAIARTLAMDPEIILFDEPTSALDPSMIGEVQSIIRMIAKTGRTMMIVTHEMDFARKIANRVIFMSDGEIYEEGTPKEIFENPQKEKTRKFIQRLSTITYRIESRDFDFAPVYDELQAYAEKLLIENERMSKLQMCLEEICMNNIFEFEAEPNIFVTIDYSEKNDILTLDIKYAGEYFDISTGDSMVFNTIIAEPTTKVQDRTDVPGKWYNNHVRIDFKWEEQ